MNQLIALTIETLLRSAIESHAMQKRMDAEGRTELTPQEEQQLRDATDGAAALARAKGEQL